MGSQNHPKSLLSPISSNVACFPRSLGGPKGRDPDNTLCPVGHATHSSQASRVIGQNVTLHPGPGAWAGLGVLGSDEGSDIFQISQSECMSVVTRPSDTISFNPDWNSEIGITNSLFQDEETEVQKGKVTCLRSHNGRVMKPKFYPQVANIKSQLLMSIFQAFLGQVHLPNSVFPLSCAGNTGSDVS